MITFALESPGFETHTDILSIIINEIYISYNQGIFYALV